MYKSVNRFMQNLAAGVEVGAAKKKLNRRQLDKARKSWRKIRSDRQREITLLRKKLKAAGYIVADSHESGVVALIEHRGQLLEFRHESQLRAFLKTAPTLANIL